MREIYWMQMPGFKNLKIPENRNPLPEFFWTGNTRMECLKRTISQSLEEAYAHHIQHLMVTGKFALLAQTGPDAVDSRYQGIYIVAIEWGELPNTRGMSQFTDGGMVGAKAYVSNANYINKMSDYCTNSAYNPHKKSGEGSCPFNTLYWNFLDSKKKYFKNNPHMALMISMLEHNEEKESAQVRARARVIINEPDLF